MFDQVLWFLGEIEEVFWAYMGAPGLIGLGLYLSFKSGFFQIRQFPAAIKIFKSYATHAHTSEKTRGIAPIYAFFASIGGAVGVGNLVGVCTAVQVGGPGAVFWMWVAGLMGMLVKYAEIFLGIKYRVQNSENSYTGGPMIYLKQVPFGAFWSVFATILMCLYGMEIFIFRTVCHTVATGWNLNLYYVIPVVLILVVGVVQGGVRLVGRICSIVIPVFLVAYIGMGLYVLMQNIMHIPAVFKTILIHAFTPCAAFGGFAGSTIVMAMSHGVRRACYSGDIGIGYASTMHAETKESNPARQAALGVIDVALEAFVVCTMSLLLILVTDVWHQGHDANFMVSMALQQYFPHVSLIWPLFIFLLGYTTLIAFFAAGRRSATILSPKYGAKIYVVLGTIFFVLFSFVGTLKECFSIVSIVGSLLLLCNLYGLFFLRDKIVFDIKHEHKE